MTGIVTGDAGTPVAGARVSILSSDTERLASVHADGAGRYALQFAGSPGANHYPRHDPPGTESAIAFVQVEAPGYERYVRFALGTTSEHLVENIRLRLVERIAAGESLTVTVAPDDTMCTIDVWPGRELVCRILRVVASHDGVLTVEAVATTAGWGPPMIELYGNNTGGPRRNPTALRVTAGEYTILIQLPWGFTGNPSFVVTTALSTP